jgi:crotonobetainyl-CoA:carnitine CoA-transferase CaiB-like acyl-CoA transferase
MASKGPLDGVRVLDLSAMIAGPWSCGILADQGADVIKIEEPTRGDMMRYTGSRKDDIGCPFFMANRGKRSVALDLRKPEGKAALKKLAATADVLLHSNRPGVMERLGLGYDELRAVRDDIIYVSISGFGETGPLAMKGAYDPIIQSFAGIAAQQGRDSGQPALLRTIVCDKVTALTTAQAISSALYARSQGRGGQHVQVSLLAASAAFVWLELTRDEAFLGPGFEILPNPVEGYRLYRFADGWASVAPGGDRPFLNMLRAFGVEDVDDPRLQTFADRMKHPDATARAMEAWQQKISVIPLHEAIARLEALDIPCAPVNSLAELAEHPGVVEAGIFQETDYPGFGHVREVRPPARFSDTPSRVAGPAPALGEHTESVLAEVGVDVVTLRGAGATR